MIKIYQKMNRPSGQADAQPPRLNVGWLGRAILKRKIMVFSVIFLIITLPIFFLVTKYQPRVEAAWMNDNWLYRTGLTIGNTGAADSDKKVKFDIDTATLITAGKMQTDCGDSRFTDMSGRALKYFIDSSGGACNTNSTDYYVLVPTINAGNTVLYHYYGNPSAQNGTVSAQFSQATFSPTSGPTGASEENGAAPAAYWKFDEGYGTTIKDTTQNANNSTSFSASWSSEDMCISGKCLSLNGTSNNISVPDSPSLSPTTAVTLETWINLNASPGDTGKSTPFFTVAQKDGGYSGMGVYGLRINTSRTVAANLSHGVGSSENKTVTTTQTLDKNKWYHLAFTYNQAASEIKIYIDGKLVKTDSTYSQFLLDSSSVFRIGIGDGRYFSGFVDDVKIYPYARTAAQIKSDFASKGSGSVKGTAASLGSSAKNSDALSNGLAGYWKMDETAANSCTGGVNDSCDSSGNVNNGAWNGSTTVSSGKFGNSTTYDGVDDYTLVTENSAWEFSSSFALSTWVYSNGTQIAYAGIVAKDQSSNMGNYGFFYDSGGTIVRFGFYGTNSVQSEVDTQTAIPTGQWVHLLGVFDDTNNTLYIYQNGELKEIDSNITNTPSTNDNSLVFGSRNAGLSSYEFSGKIDEVRIYNRALSSKEVRDLYNWAPGPNAYYSFDEGTGTTTYDKSGNGRTGTLLNNASWGPGKYGKAVKLNVDANNNQYVSVSSNVTHNYTFTKEAWIYPTSISGCLETRCSILNPYFELAGTSLQFYSYELSTQGWHTGGTISLNRWQHVTVSYDGSNLKLYLNGIVVKNIAVSRTTNFATTGVIGAYGSNQRNFKGYIDEVRIYDYARTSGQITEDMNAGHPAGGSPVGSQLGYWKFDEGQGSTANNSGSGGSGLNGTVSGTVWSNSGKYGKALNIDTVADFINIGDTAVTDSLTEMTISLWLNPTAISTSDIIMGKWAANNDSNSFMLRTTNGSADEIYVFIANALGDGGTNYLTTSNLDLVNSQWTQLTIVYNGSLEAANRLKVYKNGVLVSGTTSGTIATSLTAGSTANLKIGETDYIGFDAFLGLYDEVKIYNSALTADEVKLDYNHGSSMVLGSVSTDSTGAVADNSSAREYCVPGDTASCSAPIGEWKMDEGSGASAQDSSGGGSTGTITGATYQAGKIGKALNFNAGTDVVTVSNSLSTKTVEFWVYLTTTTQNLIDLRTDATAANISVSSGTISATGFTSPTIYVNGKVSSTLSAGSWQHVTITTGTAVTANAIRFGRISTTSLTGKLDSIRIFDYARSAAQIAWDYNRGGPTGWWKMDECQGTTAYDASGNGNNGTITIGATGTNTSAGTCTGSAGEAWKDGATGKYNSSLEFDGTNDYVNVADNSNLELPDTYSLSVWIKPSTLSGWKTILEKGASPARYMLWLNGSEVGAVGHKESAYTASTNASLVVDEWTNLIFIFDYNGSPQAQIYKNGVLLNSTNTTGIGHTPDTGSYSLRIADDPGSQNYYFTGQIDDVRVYNYALTANQVKNLYNEGSGVRFGPSSGSP